MNLYFRSNCLADVSTGYSFYILCTYSFLFVRIVIRFFFFYLALIRNRKSLNKIILINRAFDPINRIPLTEHGRDTCACMTHIT